MEKFKFFLPLKKNPDDTMTGIASATSLDRDDEKMSERAMQNMADEINSSGVNIFGNHEHNWENTLGSTYRAMVLGDKLSVDIDWDDASTNPKIPMLLNKLNRGIKLGLSVGGNVTSFKWEYDNKLRKKVKVLDSVNIYEISVVGIPSNPDAFLTPMSKSGEMVDWEDVDKCPACWNYMVKNSCSRCFYQGGVNMDIEKHCRLGQMVEVKGKRGTVVEIGDKHKVKFVDGTFEHVDESQIKTIEDDGTTLKDKIPNCQICGHPMNNEDDTCHPGKPCTYMKKDMPASQVMMEPTAAGEDPLAQPKRKTGRSVGEEQTVLGKSINTDVFAKKMLK